MTIEHRIDIWNRNKIWICKKSKCGHYYIGQKVGCLYFSPKRVHKDHYMSVFNNSILTN